MLNQRKRALTLIELMAVIIIISVLAAVIALRVFSNVESARIAKAKTDIETLKQAITFYQLNTSYVPQDLTDLVIQPNEVSGWRGPYLEEAQFIDPWNMPYQYTVPGLDGRIYEIRCLGPDRSEGGEGENRDILSWSLPLTE